MRRSQGFKKPSLALPDVRGPGIVRAVGEPKRQVSAVEPSCDLDAVLHVTQGSQANRWIGITKRTVLVFLILKEVGVDRSWRDTITVREPFDLIRALYSVRTVP